MRTALLEANALARAQLRMRHALTIIDLSSLVPVPISVLVQLQRANRNGVMVVVLDLMPRFDNGRLPAI